MRMRSGKKRYIDYVQSYQETYQQSSGVWDTMVLIEYSMVVVLIIALFVRVFMSWWSLVWSFVGFVEYVPLFLLMAYVVIKRLMNRLSPVPLIHEFIALLIFLRWYIVKKPHAEVSSWWHDTKELMS
jgi:hypothetical protein